MKVFNDLADFSAEEVRDLITLDIMAHPNEVGPQ